VTPPARPSLLLAEPAALAGARPVRKHPAPLDPASPLDTSGRTFLHAGHRRDHGLEILRYPVVACVLSGEADYRLADYVVSLPAGSFFVVPPGVPQPDGTRAHWERPHPERAHSETLWLVVLPSGAFASSCCVTAGEHLPGRARVFLPGERLPALTDLLLGELRAHPRGATDLACVLLQALVLQLQRDLQAGLAPLALPPAEALADATPVVRRVLEYVDGHLQQPLSLARLAAAAHVSAAHLQRLFTAQIGPSVMQYVTARRLALARQLLAQTDLPVAEVARLTGFVHPAHFSRVFRAAVGLAPGQYRARERNELNR
jgi:AraC-like DNA-binding protein